MIQRFWKALRALKQTTSSKVPDSLWEKDKDGREEKYLEQAYGDRPVFLNLYTSSFQFQKYLLLPSSLFKGVGPLGNPVNCSLHP